MDFENIPHDAPSARRPLSVPEAARASSTQPPTSAGTSSAARIFKETVRGHFWLVASAVEWASICRDFRVFYNDHRPHQAYGGRTPSEVHRGVSAEPWTGETISFFAGRMRWWRFG